MAWLSVQPGRRAGRLQAGFDYQQVWEIRFCIHLCRDNGQYAGGGVNARHATLRFALDTSTFELTLHGRNAQDSAVVLPDAQVTTESGVPVQPWDLWVGCNLAALGSTLLLRACSAATGACHA